MRATAISCCAPLMLLAAPVWAQTGVDLSQWSGFWTVRFEREPSGADLIAELPNDVLLIDDTGAGELERGDFGGLELTERALAAVASYDYAAELERENSCIAPSVAFYMQAPFPMELYAGRDLVVFKMEYFDMYRVVHVGATDHPPPDAPHFKSGYSIGHWEAGTLVVDTTHIAPGTFMNNGFDHSEDLHMTERFRLSEDGTTLWLTQVYEDPATFSGRAARYMAWTKRAGEHVFPYDCDPSYGD